jgi:hypothetical protein
MRDLVQRLRNMIKKGKPQEWFANSMGLDPSFDDQRADDEINGWGNLEFARALEFLAEHPNA